MRTLIPLNLALLFCSAPALATTYQVGPGRTSKTIGAVASQLNPGDIVEVDGDATYAGGIVLDRPGAVGKPITVRGLRVNGKRPVLSGGSNTIEIQGDHYLLEGFDITAGTFRCVYHHSDDVTMRDLVVHDCKAHGLLGADQDSGSLTLEYSEFYGSGSGTGEHQIYMATDEVAHPGSVFRMQHCYMHDGVGGNNVKSRAERNEIYYNWIEGALYHELELIGPDPDGAAASWTEGLKREDSDVVGNVLRKTQSSFVVRFGGDGTGQSNGRYRFVANTVLTQPGGSAVFRLFDGLESVEMHDNLFFVDPNPSGASNIVRDAEATWSAGQRIVGGSHNWVLTQASNVPSEWTMVTKGANPGLVSLAMMDLRPVPASPLADACTCITSPSGHDFPSPLPWPEFEPPLHAAEAPGAARARSVTGQLYIGAYQSNSGGGVSGSGGTTSSGGSANGGATSSGGSANGGTANGGTTSSGGSANGGTSNSGGAANGGATSNGGTTNSGGTTGSGGSATAGGAGNGGATSNGGSVKGGATNNGATSSTGATTGMTRTGGATGSGGATSTGDSGSAGALDTGASDNADAPSQSGDSGGCSCRVGATGAPHRSGGAPFVAALSVLCLASRRRRARAQ